MFNEDWCNQRQCRILSDIVTTVRNLPGEVVELGCWEGKSTVSITTAVYPDKVICVDWWRGNVTESVITGQKHVSEVILETRDVYKNFVDNMTKKTAGNYTIVKEDCLKWLETFEEPIKFCYVDASHDYPSVKRTLELLLPLMVEGGVICGSDFIGAGATRLDLQGGVERAVREILPEFRNLDNFWVYVKPNSFLQE